MPRFSTDTDVDPSQRAPAMDQLPSGPVIPLVYQLNLLTDHERLRSFATAIEQVIGPDDVVADLGCGVGTLSFLAARRARRVYSVEMDSDVADTTALFIAELGLADKVHLVRGDAATVVLPEACSVLMCEMICTGLIAERQVTVLNHGVAQLLAPGGRLLPRRATSFCELVNVDWSFEGMTLPLPHYQAYGASRVRKSISQPAAFKSVDFAGQEGVSVDERFTVTAIDAGFVNAVRITTRVELADGIVLGPTEWFAPPLIQPVAPIALARGAAAAVRLQYEMGGGVRTLRCSVSVS